MEKTCGNCYHCVPRHGTRFRKLDGVCLYTGYAVDTQSTSCVTPCGNHRMWRERKGTMEQRYQQLERVAKSLFKNLTLEWLDLDDIEEYQKQLEALGVDFDD